MRIGQVIPGFDRPEFGDANDYIHNDDAVTQAYQQSHLIKSTVMIELL